MATLLAWLAANVLPGFLKSLLGVGQAAVEQRQARADDVALGQAQQRTVDQGSALEAHQRLEKAAAAPSDAERDLGNGTF